MRALILICVFAATAFAAHCPVDRYGFECGGPRRGLCVNTTVDPLYPNETLGQCLCYEEYGGDVCEYTRKKSLTAFLLQFFLGGLGVGYFYLGLTGLGVGILLLSVLGCCLGGGLGIAGLVSGKKSIGGVGTCLGGLCAVAIFGWWLGSTIQMGMNKLNDSNGYRPYDNM